MTLISFVTYSLPLGDSNKLHDMAHSYFEHCMITKQALQCSSGSNSFCSEKRYGNIIVLVASLVITSCNNCVSKLQPQLKKTKK